MKDLKSKEGKVIRMYSFENKNNMEGRIRSLHLLRNEKHTLFSGTKAELLLKDEEFWKGIVFKHRKGEYENYISLENDTIYALPTAKESGHSATNSESGEWKLITEERI